MAVHRLSCHQWGQHPSWALVWVLSDALLPQGVLLMHHGRHYTKAKYLDPCHSCIHVGGQGWVPGFSSSSDYCSLVAIERVNFSLLHLSIIFFQINKRSTLRERNNACKWERKFIKTKGVKSIRWKGWRTYSESRVSQQSPLLDMFTWVLLPSPGSSSWLVLKIASPETILRFCSLLSFS